MNPSIGESSRKQKVGGLAALYLAAAYLVAMPYFLVFVKYPDVVDPAKKVALLAGNLDSMRAMHLIMYVIFGIVLAVLALALHARLKDEAPALAQAATAAGLIWAIALVASGRNALRNAGMTAVVGLDGTDPVQAIGAGHGVQPVAQGLGGSGGELLGGLWVLLVSVAALRAGLPRRRTGSAWRSALRGSSLSCLRSATWPTRFRGLPQIAWFAWLGVVMLRPSRQADPVVDSADALQRGNGCLPSATV